MKLDYANQPDLCMSCLAVACRALEQDIEIGVITASEADVIYRQLCESMGAPVCSSKFVDLTTLQQANLPGVPLDLADEYWTPAARQQWEDAQNLADWRRRCREAVMALRDDPVGQQPTKLLFWEKATLAFVAGFIVYLAVEAARSAVWGVLARLQP